MRKTVLKAYATFLKLVRHFSHGDEASERKFFGLGQFVLLLTLTPFIFNLSLYSFSEPQSIATYYEHDPDRFIKQDVYPPAPIQLRPHETRDLKRCATFLASERNRHRRSIERIQKLCQKLEDKQAKYETAVIANTNASYFPNYCLLHKAPKMGTITIRINRSCLSLPIICYEHCIKYRCTQPVANQPLTHPQNCLLLVCLKGPNTFKVFCLLYSRSTPEHTATESTLARRYI